MSQIDRRTLLGAAGAGLALAGLGGGAAGAQTRRPRSDGDLGGTPTGSCQLWGDSVRKARPDTEDVAFDPQYVCALYLKYEDNGRPSIRHAYKALRAPKTDEAIRETAEYVLRDLRDDEYHDDVVHVRRNFRGFTMNTQQVLVIFLDNDPAIIRLNDDQGMENLIRFTAFGGVPPYTERRKNYSFYNLHKIRMPKGLFKSNNAYRVDFWNIDETGGLLQVDSNSSPEDRYNYSMNIHMLQAPYEPDEVAAIPLILDPDTGNMGAEP